MDLNTPSASTNYATLLANLKSRDEVAYIMDFASETNIPTGALKYDRTNKRLEEWSGSAWVAKEITNLAASSVGTSQIAADAATDAKVRLANNGYLRARNAAGSADLSLVKATSSDVTRVNTPTSKALEIARADSMLWEFDASNFDLLPGSNDARKIGSASKRVAEVYAAAIRNCDAISVTGGPMSIQVQSNHALDIYTNNSKRWTVENDGDLIPNGALLFNDGDAVNAVKTVYTAEVQSDIGNSLKLHSVVGDITVWPGGTRSWNFTSGGLMPHANATYDIGSNGARVDDIFAQTLYVNTVRGNASGDIYVEAQGGSAAVVLRTNSTNLLNLKANGIFDFQNQTFDGTPGALATYWVVEFGGVQRLIPVYLP